MTPNRQQLVHRMPEVTSERQPQLERRILVMTTNQSNATAVVRVLEEFGIQGEICADAGQLRTHLEQGAGALLVSEDAVGAEFVSLVVPFFRDQPSWSDLPIIVITAGGEGVETSSKIQVLMGEWADLSFLERPFRALTLVGIVQAALRSRSHQYRVRDLIIGQDRQMREIQRLNQELQRLLEQRDNALTNISEQLETLCYSVAHDFRAPLRAQVGFAMALLEEYGSALGEQGREFALRILKSGERMDELVRDLLAYSRIGREQVELRPIPLEEVTRTALAKFREPLERKELAVTVQQPLPTVLGNQLSLELVLVNLLSNAMTFVAPGVHAIVNIRAETRGGAVRLWVEDNGIGISPEHQERIFGVFERLHPAEQFPGTGIGLAIVRQAVNRMGGAVGVESEPGRGSRFWIELPAAVQR